MEFSLWQKKQEQFETIISKVEPVFDQVSNILGCDAAARQIVLDYCTILMCWYKGQIIYLNPLVCWQLTLGLNCVDTSVIDAINWDEVSPMVFAWLYNHLMDAQTKDKNSAIYTPEPIVDFMVESAISWRVIANEILEQKVELHNPFDITNLALDDLLRFQERLADLKICDPCCGCGNFLHGALHRLKKLERDIMNEIKRKGGTTKELTSIHQLHGVDIDAEAIEICKRVMQFTWWDTKISSGARLPRLGLKFGFYIDNQGSLDKIFTGDTLEPETGKKLTKVGAF